MEAPVRLRMRKWFLAETGHVCAETISLAVSGSNDLCMAIGMKE